MTLPGFPDYSALSTRVRIADLVRLAEVDLTKNEYVYGRGIAKLLSAMLKGYVAASECDWNSDPFTKKALDESQLFGLFLAAIFDLATNIEYAHKRLVNSKWIYCRREEDETSTAFYSFLKQCPRCCLDIGLEGRLSGAQHKPPSHHIGEITTTVIALLLKLIAQGNQSRLSIATITKQSHDVDAIGYCDDFVALFEIKASPMVTYPYRYPLSAPLFQQEGDDVREYRQHQLIDVLPDMSAIGLFLPHRQTTIPLDRLPADVHWPYEAAQRAFTDPSWVQTYFSAWLELFYAYSVPKTLRNLDEQKLSYLVNGWGDEIDSNKTKPGLGRTDDIKKGTYQLIKFGAYFNDENARLKVRGVLVGNLDPLFLRASYFDGLKNIRWGQDARFRDEGAYYRIEKRYLHYLYSAVITFNEPIVNDTMMANSFDLSVAENALKTGMLDDLLDEWATGDVDSTLVSG